MKVLPARLAREEHWQEHDAPLLFVAFVEIPDAKAWHAGQLSDDELWAKAEDPIEAQFCVLFVRRIIGKTSWKSLGKIVDTMQPAGICMGATHPTIQARAEFYGFTRGVLDASGHARWLRLGNPWEDWRGRFHHSGRNSTR